MVDNSDTILQKKKEIDENYQKCQKILIDLNEKKERFIKDLDDSRNQQQNLMKELADINVEIEKYKDNIDRFIHENPKLGLEELEKKCRQVISRFFDDLTVNSQK
jgi:predicted nuclease with TOPRIM domain